MSFIGPTPLIVDASMAADVTSRATSMQQLPEMSFDISWTGTPTGTFSVQVSNTYTQSPEGVVQNAGSWNDVVLSVVPAAAGADGSAFINLAEMAGLWVRLVYHRTSGTGVLNATVFGKNCS